MEQFIHLLLTIVIETYSKMFVSFMRGFPTLVDKD